MASQRNVHAGISLASNTRTAFRTLLRVLESIGWQFEADHDAMRTVIAFGLPENPISDLLCVIEPGTQCLIASFNFGRVSSADVMAEVVRFSTRANWDLSIGNFEADIGGNQVRFRASIPFAGNELPESSVRCLLASAIGAVDTYGEALQRVIQGQSLADDALKSVKAAGCGSDA